MIKKSFIFIFTILLLMPLAFSDTAYKNELLKVNLTPMGVNDVKITLHMAKPYSEPLRLLKKNDGEFVLILPETYNSAPQKPSISEVIGDVTDTDIKQYSFISNSKENGYTKIVIRTNGTTNLYTETVSNGSGSLKVNDTVKKAVKEQVQPKVDTKQIALNVPTLKKEVEKSATKTEETKQKDKNQATNDKVKKEKTDFSAKNILPIFKDVKPSKKEVAPEVTEEEKVAENSIIEGSEENIVNHEDSIIEDETIELVQKENVPFITKIQNNLSALKSKLPHNYKKNSLITLMLIAICYFLIKKSQKSNKKNDFVEENEDKPQYSEFFKSVIENENNASNPFSINPPTINITDDEYKTSIEKTQKELFDIDPNLSWQEKFRALKKNKKDLFKDDEKTDDTQKKSEIMQNPVTKIKQDLKAIKTLVAQQKAQKEEAIKEQQSQNKVEVISFDDYQKNIEPPKVKINTTVPLDTKPPKVLSQLLFAPKKGLYLVDYKDKYNLVGFVGDKVFKIRSYDNVRNSKIYARLTEKFEDKETYIVKFDNNKMLIDVDDAKMSLKLQY